MITSAYRDDCYEFRGLSTDIKPIGDKISNGSVFFEIDTEEVYMYNAQDSTWLSLSGEGEGGGGSKSAISFDADANTLLFQDNLIYPKTKVTSIINEDGTPFVVPELTFNKDLNLLLYQNNIIYPKTKINSIVNEDGTPLDTSTFGSDTYIINLLLDPETDTLAEVSPIDWVKVNDLISKHKFNDVYIMVLTMHAFLPLKCKYKLDTVIGDFSDNNDDILVTKAMFKYSCPKIDGYTNGEANIDGLQLLYIKLDLQAKTFEYINSPKNIGTHVVANPSLTDDEIAHNTSNLLYMTIGAYNYRLPTQISYPADQIPAAPADAGTYTLECTVSPASASPVYTWIKKQ